MGNARYAALGLASALALGFAVIMLGQRRKHAGRRLGQPDERDRTIAWAILDSARRAHAWRPGKVFIADVFEQLRRDGRDDGLTLDEFKRELVRLHRVGALRLSRADLVAAMPPMSVRRSEVKAGPAEFHFVRLDGRR